MKHDASNCNASSRATDSLYHNKIGACSLKKMLKIIMFKIIMFKIIMFKEHNIKMAYHRDGSCIDINELFMLGSTK